MDDVIIKVEHLSKMYKLYDKKSDRLREAVSFSNKKYYKEFYALNDINFDVMRGETVGIIGTNGSGKSTLLKILTGVVAPSGGTYEVNGKVSALLELGTGFNMEYTGLQNIDLYGTMSGYTGEEMKTRREEIIRFADIGDYINQPVKNYSSGMFARLAFAAAISIEPEILIVDEALSVGDVFFQSKCFRKFDELMEKGTSILFVSHDTAQVRKMCSRVLWIEKGLQQMFGDSDEVCKAYFSMQLDQMNRQNEQLLDYLEGNPINVEQSQPRTVSYPSIAPASNSIFSDRAEIISAFVRNQDGQYTNELTADGVYTIGIVSRFNEDMDNVIVGFAMNNLKGEVVLAGNTYESKETVFSVKAGEILETTFQITMPRFRSGAYEITPAIALGIQKTHVNLTWLYGVLAIQIRRTGYEISEVGIDYQFSNTIVEGYSLF